MNSRLRTMSSPRGPASAVPASSSAPLKTTLPALARVSAWVTSQQYTQTAINIFLQAADYYLVGEALARGDVVVSHEVGANTVNKVKIPNVCVALRIKCVTPYDMLRISRARFDLRSK